ncbi:MAG TPA: serine hydrolase [Bacteroidota bacterium]
MRFSPVLTTLCILATVASGQERIDRWEKNTESFRRERIEELKQRIADSTYKEINSIIVIRNGRLLLEEYFNGATREKKHNPRSVGKTFASAVLGIALKDRYIKSVDQTLSDFYDLTKYDNFDDKKVRVSLKHLLTMTSGFDGFDFNEKSIGNEENMYPQSDWVLWTLNLPMAQDRRPGDRWYYFTAGIVVLGDILNRTLPGGLEAYADSAFFKPLGIFDYEWQHTPQGVPNTAGGIMLRPLDFAKFGQVYKNEGAWGGRQILPKSWIAESLQKHSQTTNEGERYGYLWWNKTYQAGGKSHDVYYCSGNGGNKIFVFADYPLVVVVTASAYGKRYAHTQVDEMMQHYIIPAIIN